ncbi:DEAD/DEAH box helicase family protein [Microbacterium sp. MEC084]|uniref:restriction endonuclease n=1 Tax=Microbacterium sp. MEC084 TaxID=1963027 RepID=UPI0010706651|nr:DEAD/DEAH box helicase family protein [Microbacterium sp. MEC084]MCD1269886.1 DEAD/DEAH box helicase family protein [Microbacterium sp. MEC084]
MKLQFKVQEYQTAVVDAVVDCFRAVHRQPFADNITYKIDPGRTTGRRGQPELDHRVDDAAAQTGYGNSALLLNPAQLLDNIQVVQRRISGLPLSGELIASPAAGLNLDVEMETGTGKTYVYIKTIMELHRQFGWSKFVVVVPSVAIREGVKKSFEITADHFLAEYKTQARAFVYNSDHLQDVETFSSDTGIQVMIINAQNFNRDAKKADRGAAETGKSSGLKMFKTLDGFKSRRPIDVIAANRPILIIDEPQRLGSNPSRPSETLKALGRFNALFALRYSATHAIDHNKVHRLDALDAYNKKLVKKIAARGISVKGLAGSSAYLYVDGIELGKGADFPKARIEINHQPLHGEIRPKTFKVKKGDRLHDISGGVEAYKGLVIDDIDAIANTVTLMDGQVLQGGQITNDVTDEQKRRLQIREVIRAHLDKERQLFGHGIKVLSLFFIDEVQKYRDYDQPDGLGEYARVFEQEYEALKAERFSELGLDESEEAYRAFLERDAVRSIHNGYFSVDKKTGRWVDSDASEASDEKGKGLSKDAEAYDAILRDKEKLLDRDYPLRFIFSHSALREGWDNPNVFTLGFLKKATAGDSRRQEVGRGLRLAVDHNGDRADDPVTVHDINVLTVVTEESYVDFVAGFQKETLGLLSARPRKATPEFFVGAVLRDAIAGAEHKVTLDEAKQLHHWLIKHDFIDYDQHLTDKWLRRSDLPEIPAMPPALQPYFYQVADLIDSLHIQAPKVDDGRKAKIVPMNKANFNKREFQELWARINHRVVYQVEFDSQELIDNCTRVLDTSLEVARLRYVVTEGVQRDVIEAEHLEAGESFKVTRTKSSESTLSASSTIPYDLIGEIAEKTKLTRRTVATILRGVRPDTFAKFKQNPEQFITEAARLIREQAAATMVEHIEYDILEDRYHTSIFTENQTSHDLSKAVHTPNKNVYEYVLDDSQVEREFGAALDISEEVSVFTKLPRGFKIPTPLDYYNPDWAIAFHDGAVKHVYFVAETKFSLSSLELRGAEKAKIDCANKLFEKLEQVAGTPGVRYHGVTSYDHLLQLVGA